MSELFKNDVHELKILPQWFEDIKTGKKKFELRKADRDFKVGDYLYLREFENGEYTGRNCYVVIKYIFKGTGEYGLSEGYWILGIF